MGLFRVSGSGDVDGCGRERYWLPRRGRRPWVLRLDRAWSCVGRVGLVSVTGEDGWLGTSSKLTDVRRAPRVVMWLGLISEVGIHAKGKGENQRSLTGVWRKTLRLVARSFVWLLVLEELKIDGIDSTGGQM